MVKFKICYSIGTYNDEYVVEGETIEDVQKKVKLEDEKRGLDSEKNNMFSIQLK